MNNAELEAKLLEYLKKNLPPDRYHHVMGMAEFARHLAEKHGLSWERAHLAALLHDLARSWGDRKLLQYARKNRIQAPNLDFICEHHPILLHSYVGAHLAKKLFGVRDAEVLSAVAKHSLGGVKMTPFEKVVYLADLLAPDRDFPGVDTLRKLAFENLDRAYLEAIRTKLLYLLGSHQPIHPEAIKTWNWLVETEASPKRAKR